MDRNFYTRLTSQELLRRRFRVFSSVLLRCRTRRSRPLCKEVTRVAARLQVRHHMVVVWVSLLGPCNRLACCEGLDECERKNRRSMWHRKTVFHASIPTDNQALLPRIDIDWNTLSALSFYTLDSKLLPICSFALRFPLLHSSPRAGICAPSLSERTCSRCSTSTTNIQNYKKHHMFRDRVLCKILNPLANERRN